MITGMQRHSFRNKLIFGLFLLVLVLFAQLRLTPYFVRPGVDSGIFSYIGSRILEGEIPYIDLWDNKPPVTYYLNAIAQSIAGANPWAAWWLGLFWIQITIVLFYIFLYGYVHQSAAFGGALLFLFTLHHPTIYEGGNFTEIYALLPQVLLIGSLSKYFLTRNSVWVLISGLLAGWVAMTSITAVGMSIAGLFGTILFTYVRTTKGNRAVLKTLFAWGVGAAVPILIILYYWNLRDGLIDLWNILFKFNFVYIEGGFTLRSIYTSVRRFLLSQPLSTLSLLAASVTSYYLLNWIGNHEVRADLLSRKNIRGIFKCNLLNPKEYVLLVAVLGIGLQVLLISLSGKDFGHYYINALPPLSILSTFFLDSFGSRNFQLDPNNRPRILGNLLLVFVLVAWFLEIFGWVFPDKEHLRATPKIMQTAEFRMDGLDRYILENTSPDEYILVWDWDLRVNFVTNRQTPSKYMFPFPLVLDSGEDEHEFNRYFSDLGEKMPKYIIINQYDDLIDYFIHPDVPVCQDCNEQTKNGLMAFANLIEENYREIDKVQEWVIFSQ